MKNYLYKYFLVIALVIFGIIVVAHQPEIPTNNMETVLGGELVLESAIEIKDPTEASQAVYDLIKEPKQVVLYKFTVSQDDEIPLEVLVPVRKSNRHFYPSFALISDSFQFDSDDYLNELPFGLPNGYDYMLVENIKNEDEEREVFFEPFSFERLYHGNEKITPVFADETYFVAVFEPDNQTGDFSFGVGTAEDFSDVSFFGLVKDIIKIKLKIVGGEQIPWNEIFGLFILMAGFVIGLGAVTVIDTLGFLGINSTYWTETTIRAHKVTKPFIWIGILLVFVGSAIFYKSVGNFLSSVATIQLFIFVLLILNGLYLSFYISPLLLKREKEGMAKELLPIKIKTRIGVSFIISIVGWWSALFLLSWYLVFVM
ncbi:hypothetical protein ACFLY7_00465 [Patescibacteria group bacterium]